MESGEIVNQEISAETAKLFDEEGSIVVRKESIRCCVATPDSAQITGFATAVGYGRITKQRQHNITLYVWSAFNMQALSFLTQVIPYLTGRRREQATAALARVPIP
jgi:hypothetical protein